MENRANSISVEGDEASRWEMIEAHAFEAVNFYATLWEIVQFEWDRMRAGLPSLNLWSKFIALIVGHHRNFVRRIGSDFSFIRTRRVCLPQFFSFDQNEDEDSLENYENVSTLNEILEIFGETEFAEDGSIRFRCENYGRSFRVPVYESPYFSKKKPEAFILAEKSSGNFGAMEAELARLRQQVAMLLERSSLVAAVPNSLIPVEQNESQNGAKKSNSSTDSGVSDAEDFEPLDSNETKNAVPVALPPALAPPPPPPIPPPSPLKLDLAKPVSIRSKIFRVKGGNAGSCSPAEPVVPNAEKPAPSMADVMKELRAGTHRLRPVAQRSPGGTPSKKIRIPALSLLEAMLKQKFENANGAGDESPPSHADTSQLSECWSASSPEVTPKKAPKLCPKANTNDE